MKKLNKQVLIDLEKKSKQLRLLDKTNIHDFTKALVDFQEYLEAITTSIDKELEKYGYCEKCGSYHNIDSQKYECDIHENETNFGYYYDVCPICGNRVFIMKKLIERRKANQQ